MNPEPVLEIADLRVDRDGRPAIEGVSLEVAPGEIHVLVGPNGAGKSTLLQAVLGLLDFDGRVTLRWRGSGRLGWVPQSFAVDRTLPITVGEFLALSRQRRPVCLGVGRRVRAGIESLLAMVGLDGFFARELSALSGGELQRLLLANAVDPAPELLLLDEPGGGLDEAATARMEDVITRLSRESGTAVLMVSHDFGQVRRLADRVTVVERVVRRSGTPADVLAGEPADLPVLP
ncbi:MAG: metal ABC transporter ATP-binding protein [Alphaproteobacteria bacterium]